APVSARARNLGNGSRSGTMTMSPIVAAPADARNCVVGENTGSRVVGVLWLPAAYTTFDVKVSWTNPVMGSTATPVTTASPMVDEPLVRTRLPSREIRGVVATLATLLADG